MPTDKRELLLVIKGRDQGAKDALDGVGDAAEGAKDDLQDMSAGLKRLDGRIAESTKTVEGLRREIARSGDLGLVKDLQKADRELNRLTRERKLILGVEVDRDVARIDKRLDELTRRREALVEVDAEDDIREVDEQLDELTRRRTALVNVSLDKAAARKATAGLDDLLADTGKEAAAGFATSFVARAGPLIVSKAPVSLGGAGGAIGAGLAIGAVPVIGAAISGAIVGGAGAAGIIGGLSIAARHPAVKAEAESLGNEVSSILQRAAVSFVPAAREGIKEIAKDFRAAEDDLTVLFGATSRFVAPLADALGDAFRDVLHGVRLLAERAGPVINVTAAGFRRIGDAIGDGLGDLADNANEGARALAVMFTVVEYGIKAVFKLVDGLSEMGSLMEKVGGALRGDFSPVIRDMYEDQIKAADGSGVLSKELEHLLNGFKETGETVEDASASLRDYLAVSQRITDQNITAAEAQLNYKEALDLTRKAADGKARVSRDEEKAILDLARSSNDVTRALIDQGAATADVARQQEIARANLIKSAMAMGYSKAEAHRLADQYLDVPTLVTTKFNAQTGTAEDNLRRLRELISQIRSKRVVITVDNRGRQTVRAGGRNVPIGDLGGMSEGGYVDGPGPKGVDSIPRMVAPGEYMLDAGDVDKLGGPAQIDAWRRDLDRGLTSFRAPAMAARGGGSGRLEVVARWAGGGGPLGDLGAALTRHIKLEVVNLGGGDVQAAYGRRR